MWMDSLGYFSTMPWITSLGCHYEYGKKDYESSD